MTEFVSLNKVEVAQQLSASVGASDDEFGACIDLDGDWMAIGAPMADPAAGSAAGRVFIFKKTAGTWAQTQIIEGTVAGDEFGAQVALSGDKLAVGWLKSDTIAAGAGSVYTYTLSGGTWVFESELVPSISIGSTGGTYGSRIHMDGDIIIIGKPSALSGQSGRVFAFHWSGSAWVEKTFPLPATVGSNDNFGNSVSVSESALRCVCGAPNDDDGGTDAGAAYVYEYNGSTAWVEIQKLVAVTSPGASDYFGTSVGISKDGSTIAVGAYGYDDPTTTSGAIYVFEYVGATWAEQAVLEKEVTVGSNVSSYIGFCQISTSWDAEGQKRIILTADGSTIIVGDCYSAELTTTCGAVHWWTKGGSGWGTSFDAHVIYPDIKQGGFNTGAGVAYDPVEETFILSILDDDGVTTDSGTVYVVNEAPWDAGGVVDVTPPTATLVTPAAAGTPIGQADPIVFDVFDETSLAHTEVRALQNTEEDPPVPIWETIYDGSTFVGKYTGSSIAVLGAANFRFTVVRVGGWNTPPSISVTPIDHGGNKV